MVPRKGLEPPLSYREADFKSAASTIPPPGHNNQVFSITFQIETNLGFYRVIDLLMTTSVADI